MLRPRSQLQTRLPLASTPPRSRSRSDHCASWNGATGHASATAATSALTGAWTAIPALASTAWCGCVGPTAPNSQATDSSVTPVATARRQDACLWRWPGSASWIITGRHSGQLGTRSRTSTSHPLVSSLRFLAPNAGVICKARAPRNLGRRHPARPGAQDQRAKRTFRNLVGWLMRYFGRPEGWLLTPGLAATPPRRRPRRR
jgi:hypothetical protein